MCVVDSLVVLGLATLSLGTVSDEQPREHTFAVENVGSDTVTLGQGYTSCGCTTVAYERGRRLAPGDTAHIAVRFNPRGKSGPFEETAIVVYTATRRHLTLTLEGNVAPSREALLRRFPIAAGRLRLSTDRFDLGPRRRGETVERTVVVLHPDGRQEAVPIRYTASGPLGLHHERVDVGGATVTIDVVVKE